MRLIDADALLDELPVHPDNGLRSIAGEILMIRVRQTVIDAPTIGGWISVKDRLPGLKDDVLILYERTGISEEKYREIDIESFRTMKHFGYVPLFWMPLPEPPKEDK